MSTHSLLLVAAIATSPVTAIASDWQFIGTAADETVYFGKPLTVEGDTTVIRLKAVNDPEEPKPYKFSFAVKCATRQFLDAEGDWKPVDKEKMGYYWFRFACKK